MTIIKRYFTDREKMFDYHSPDKAMSRYIKIYKPLKINQNKETNKQPIESGKRDKQILF